MRANILIVLFLGTILLVGCETQVSEIGQNKGLVQIPKDEEKRILPKHEDVLKNTPLQEQPPQQEMQSSWKFGGIAIAGNYADAEVIELGDGDYRMYYSIEPEVQGNKLEVFSATSIDGINWKKEGGVRKEFATFPDVVRLSDGRFRIYFQNAGVIKSATSHDGLNWIDDQGIRIDRPESEFKLENAGAQSTIRLEDGTYIMVYRGVINEEYREEKVPNKQTSLLFWATSRDGMSWEKKGLAVDTRNIVFKGWADGPDLVPWDDGAVWLYFASYAGIFHAEYKDGVFTSTPTFDYTIGTGPFPMNPPGDPTLAKINGKWFMYYGQHTKGIYYATLDQQQGPSQSIQSSEKLSIPPSIENSCVGFKIDGPDKVATINLIGAGWATHMWPHFTWGRIEKEPGIYDFSEMDKIVRIAQENNVTVLAELQPFADWDQAWDKNCKAKENSYLCKPKDMQAYKRFVAKTIERYDGDGENDMPDLKIPIKYWQIINEPDIKEDPYAIFFVGDAKDYFEVLKESYQTIKKVCPDCKVLHGAAAGVRSDMISFWSDVFELGGADYFDIANIHYVGIDVATGKTVSLGDLSTLNVKPFKELLKRHGIQKPIWVSEVVLESPSAKSSLQGALSAGASKVFFVGFGIEESAPVGKYSVDYKGIVELCHNTS